MSSDESAVPVTVDKKISPDLTPPDTLAVIFKYLSVEDRGKAAVVCRKWRQVFQEPSLWRDATCVVVLGCHIPLDTLWQRRVSRFRIRQGDCSWPNLFQLLDVVVNPQSFDFAGCRLMTDAILLTAFHSEMRSLTSLSLQSCVLLSDASIAHITEKMSQLVSLDVSFCHLLTDESLLSIAIELPLLTQLNINFLKLVTDVGIGYLAGAPIRGQGEVRQVPRIVELGLYGCDLLTDAALQHLSTMEQLKVLNLSCCSRFGDDGLIFLSNLNNLRVLDVSHCLGVHFRGLAALSRIASLRCLELVGCPNASINGLSDMGVESRIKSLNVTGCRRLGQMALAVIATRLFHLRQLFVNHDHITERGMALVAQNLQRLEHLNVWQPNQTWSCYSFERS